MQLAKAGRELACGVANERMVQPMSSGSFMCYARTTTGIELLCTDVPEATIDSQLT